MNDVHLPGFRVRSNRALLTFCHFAWLFSIVLALFNAFVDFIPKPGVIGHLLFTFACALLGLALPKGYQRVIALLVMVYTVYVMRVMMRDLAAFGYMFEPFPPHWVHYRS